MENIIKQKIKGLDLFKSIKEETISGLVSIGEIRCFRKGAHVFMDKDEVNKIYVVSDGKVALYKLGEQAQKKIVFILGKGEIINAVVLDDLRASINCEAFENCEILAFDKREFSKLMEGDYELVKIVVGSLTIKVRRLYRQMKNTTPIKVEKRVAAKLWKLSKDYGVKVNEGILIDLPLSVTYLSDMFGTPRETISRALKFLQNEGYIINKNKKIIILDREKLSKFFKGL